MECVTTGRSSNNASQNTSVLPTIHFGLIRTLALNAIGARTLVFNTCGELTVHGFGPGPILFRDGGYCSLCELLWTSLAPVQTYPR